jgi:hypothetical protein
MIYLFYNVCKKHSNVYEGSIFKTKSLQIEPVGFLIISWLEMANLFQTFED